MALSTWQSKIRLPTYQNWCWGGFQVGCLLMLSMMGCAPDTVTVKTHPTFAPSSITTIAVIPFTAVKGSPGVYQSFGDVPPSQVGSPEIRPSFAEPDSPLPHRTHANQVSVPVGSEQKVTEMVYANLKLRPGLKTYSEDEVNRVLERSGLDPSQLSFPKLAQALGKALSVDAVVAGRVRVYREREGQKYGAIPAAVGFDVQVINAKDGTVVWMGDYFEEQKPFTEDFKGMLERGGKYLTAEELARSGVKRVMQRLPIGTS